MSWRFPFGPGAALQGDGSPARRVQGMEHGADLLPRRLQQSAPLRKTPPQASPKRKTIFLRIVLTNLRVSGNISLALSDSAEKLGV